MTCTKRPSSKEAVIYCRSAAGDAAIPFHIETQEDRCRSYAMERGYCVTRIFTETGISNKAKDRPGIADLLAHLETRKRARETGKSPAGDEGDCIVIMDDICRLSRDLRQHMGLKVEIKAAGGQIEYANFPMSDTPEDRLIESILISTAQLQASKKGTYHTGD